MSFLEYIKSLKPEHRLAWLVAAGVDALQILAFPIFVEGGVSPADSVLDLIAAAALTKLIGWHWAFLPSFAAKLVPGADLFPTWTAAVWYATRGELKEGAVEILPPEHAPEAKR